MSDEKAPFLGDKPWWKSVTVWAAILIGAVEAAAAADAFPPEWKATIQTLLAVAGALGLRRAVGKQGS